MITKLYHIAFSIGSNGSSNDHQVTAKGIGSQLNILALGCVESKTLAQPKLPPQLDRQFTSGNLCQVTAWQLIPKNDCCQFQHLVGLCCVLLGQNRPISQQHTANFVVFSQKQRE
eukprot:15365789-Ditylum_brightwellii.AAC.1